MAVVGWAPSGSIHCGMFQDALPSLPLDHDQVRARLVRRGLQLSVFALVVVSVEAGVSLSAGVAAGSVALLGYGADSVIEFVSGIAALWRLSADRDAAKRARAERLTGRIIGVCFLALVVYVLVDASVTIIRHVPPHPSGVGIAVAILSLAAMPILARAKRRVAVGLGSRALTSDAAQSSVCAYLSAILLGGLALNALAGWWWADPVSALLMTPIIGQEGIRTLRGQAAGSDGCCAVIGSP
jgi:divalent metal cation (Fe/Co/Zn/Cd) transporter